MITIVQLAAALILILLNNADCYFAYYAKLMRRVRERWVAIIDTLTEYQIVRSYLARDNMNIMRTYVIYISFSSDYEFMYYTKFVLEN